MMLNVHLAMWGYIPLVFLLFHMMEKRQAMLWSTLIAVLFLPMWGYKVQGLPPYDKVSAGQMVPLLAAMIFDWPRVAKFRWRWFDLPVTMLCLCSLFSSLANGLGVYDGLSGVMCQIAEWGPAYVLGRVYCNDLAGIRETARIIFIGGVLYIPFCLWEIRMSPGLHLLVYGFYQHNILQQMRYGGFRPMVFMQHGLAVGIWMACASISGLVLWRTKTMTELWGMPMSVLSPALIITTVWCKSTGSIGILFGGITGFLLLQLGKKRFIIFFMLLVPPAYMVSRLTGLLPAETATLWVDKNIDDERGDSLHARMIQEDLFGAKAMQRPIFGWGGWGRSWPVDENGELMTRGLDSLWIIYLGENGFFGLAALTLSFLLPPFLLLWRASGKLWVHPRGSPATAIALMLIMYMIDNLSNGMLCPLMMVCAGGLSGWVMMTGQENEAAIPAATRAAAGRPPRPLLKGAAPLVR